MYLGLLILKELMIAVRFAVSVVCERFCERQMHSTDDVYNEKET